MESRKSFRLGAGRRLSSTVFGDCFCGRSGPTVSRTGLPPASHRPPRRVPTAARIQDRPAAGHRVRPPDPTRHRPITNSARISGGIPWVWDNRVIGFEIPTHNFQINPSLQISIPKPIRNIDSVGMAVGSGQGRGGYPASRVFQSNSRTVFQPFVPFEIWKLGVGCFALPRVFPCQSDGAP